MESWQRQRLAPVLRNWLKEDVAAGVNWETFKDLVRLSQETLSTPDSAPLRLDEATQVSEMLRTNNNEFNILRQDYREALAQYDSECWNSFWMHADLIR